MKQLDVYLAKGTDAIFLSVGARPSPLAQIQVEEVVQELKAMYSDRTFAIQSITIPTQGDLDLETSLRSLDKTSFFTREIDAALLLGRVRLAIHSAKDLPDPLPSGLKLICLTQGLDPSDSLVVRGGMSLKELPPGSRIGTSSLRREVAVLRLRPDCVMVDIRGTIGERLQKLERGSIDGLVIAEAALLRLGLTSLHRIRLPDCYTPLQGQLAVVAREQDLEMEELFAPLDSRK